MTKEEFKNLTVGDIIQLSFEKRFRNSFLNPGALAEIQKNEKIGNKRIVKIFFLKKEDVNNEKIREESQISDSREEIMIKCCWTYDAWEIYSKINEVYMINRLKAIED